MENKNCPSVHIGAQKDEIAKTVLMPGDPMRAKFIAENFLSGAKLVNSVRCELGYTGDYKGTKVTVMASGMGVPSIGIYSYELFNFYDVDNIIRVGTAGSIRRDIHARDMILAQGACTNSNYISQFGLGAGTAFAPIASYPLLSFAIQSAQELGVKCRVGNILTVDTFYDADNERLIKWAELGVMAVEMEAAALYTNAAASGKNALAILTVSNSLVADEETTPEEREKGFTAMMETALETALKAQ